MSGRFSPPPSGAVGAPGTPAVIPLVIPPGRTGPSQTALNRIAAQPDLARPNWTVENGRLAVIS